MDMKSTERDIFDALLVRRSMVRKLRPARETFLIARLVAVPAVAPA
jgi:hypothetical protein